MEVANYMETFVREFMEELLEEYPDICQCETCKRDMASFALNRLPPKYTTTHLGRVYTKSSVLDTQVRTDIVRALIQGIESVRQNPRHSVK